MPNRDLILLETVRTHRARLVSAFVYGELTQRRTANDNLRRLIGGIVAAAVLCVGCLGFSFVGGILARQAADRAIQAGLGPATGVAFAADTFDRTVGEGWGSAERGGAWTTIGPRQDYSVGSGAASLALPRGQQRGGYLPGQLQDRSDLTVTVRRTAAARDGDVVVSVVGRRVSSTQDYRANVLLAADGTVSVALVRRSDPIRPNEPAEVALSDTVTLLGPGGGSDPEPPEVTVRMQTLGTNTTTLRAKVWVDREPSGWTVQGSDGTGGLQRPGSVGVLAVGTGGGSELAITDVVGRVAP